METQNKNQTLTLINRKQLSLSGIEKMLSVKPDLIQVSTNLGIVQIGGANMEVSKLDLDSKILEVSGIINSIKYLQENKTPLLKRIFK